MGEHAILSPSGAERWMNCAGAPAMEKGLPDEDNEYSIEGTCAHVVAAKCLVERKQATAYVGQSFDGYKFHEDMAEPVQRYVDTVLRYADGGQLLVEQRVSIEIFTGEVGAKGTADAVVIRPGELALIDLKFGMGVQVRAARNRQLMLYALGVREEQELAYGPFERIRLVISQPRLDGYLDEWDCTAAELDAFANEVSVRADEAHGVMLIHGDGGDISQYLNPSDDACRWCKAKAICPALAKFVQDAAGADFSAVSPDPVMVTVPAENFSPALLAQKMAAIPLIEDWCKAVRAEVERQLFAGVEVPGWKVVQGKRGNRQWTDVEAADALLQRMRMRQEERYKMTLLSPPAIEKVLKSTPRRWKRVLDAGLIEQRDGLPSVAPADDKRPAWAPPDTSNDFTATEESMT
ncbi:MAG: DUF2800 domain-containing protein [Deltaproteobacteria bacterium]|nr:DUF2800 domain-containing protein [Deltaproteobacteria bacterium]